MIVVVKNALTSGPFLVYDYRLFENYPLTDGMKEVNIDSFVPHKKYMVEIKNLTDNSYTHYWNGGTVDSNEFFPTTLEGRALALHSIYHKEFKAIDAIREQIIEDLPSDLSMFSAKNARQFIFDLVMMVKSKEKEYQDLLSDSQYVDKLLEASWHG
jgi:hypothetical protein